MNQTDLPQIKEQRRLGSPTIAPQALAWHQGMLWLGSRDLRRIYRIDPVTWKVLEEKEAPGIPWAAVSMGDALAFTIGEGAEDDRYIWRYRPESGFDETGRFACPEMTGSYLSYDGEHLYLSQWYEKRILKLDSDGKILRSIAVGAEICGHTFVDGMIHVLRGSEKPEENWTIARIDPKEDVPVAQDLARVPFACRSLTHNGSQFWTNHRAANETVCFTA